MEQVLGEDKKKSTRRSKNIILKETFLVNDEHIYRVGELKSNDGELPLFSSSSSPHLHSEVTDLAFDHKHVEPKCSLGSQESGSWASSFRFELDTQDDKRLQEILKRDEQIPLGETNLGEKLIKCQSLMDFGTSDSGSFRFMGNEDLKNGNQYGNLKLPRHPGSFGSTMVFNANESQRYGIVARSGGSLIEGPTCIKVPMKDHVVASPRREVLRRLRDLKAHPLSPRFSLEDIASHQQEKVKINVMKNDIQQRLKPLLQNEYLGKKSSKSISQHHCKSQSNMPIEQEIIEFKERRRQNFSLPSKLQGSPQRPPQPPLPMHSTTLTLKFKGDRIKLPDGHSKQDNIVVNNIDSYSLDHVDSKHVAIPFTWEDEPGKPKTIAAAVDRVLAHRLSKDGMEQPKLKLDSQKNDANSSSENEHSMKGIGQEALKQSLSSSSNVDQRSSSHRYYGRDYLTSLSREASFRRSSKRYSSAEKEVLIDLDGVAATKFLVEASESPSRSHGSSPTFLVPFKWEDTPGRAKIETIAQRPNNELQLPPRLVLPPLSRHESFSSRKHRASSSFSGFFLPCLAGSLPIQQKEFTSSFNPPQRQPNPHEHLKRFGLVSLCNSTPKEGCQVWVSKSETSIHITTENLLTEAQLTPAQKCTNPSISKLKIKSNEPSSPTNILSGLNKYSSQTSSSSMMFSSGDLEDFTIQIQKLASKSSSNTSYEYMEEDLAEIPQSATTKLVVDNLFYNRKRAPTSSAYSNSKGEPFTSKTLPTLQPKTSASLGASLMQPSRLPYTMPCVSEQLLVSCSTSGRRQLLQDLSPRLLHQLSSRRHFASHSSANIPYRHLSSASHEKVGSPPPPHITSMDLLSSSTNQQTTKALVSKPPPTRPRWRIRLMSSIFKTLKRALGKKTRSFKRSEPMLTYIDDGKSPATANFLLKTT